jgi:lysophospholipase L1-like esterase
VLPEGSRIPCAVPSDLRRPAGTQRFTLKHRDGGDEIRFGATREYHDLQVEVTYEHPAEAWKGPLPEPPGDRLVRTVARLAAKRPLRIGLIGDSISTGCNASGWAKAPPFQPPWQELFRRALEARSVSKVALDNHAVGGTSSAWGLEKIGALLEGGPDLVLIAFGMNDAGGTTAEGYRANVQAMLDQVRKARPDTDVILVSPMRANPDWTALKHERFAEYREHLLALRGPGVEVADLTSLWTAFLELKRDADLSGNGVNHPNDFGHRVYAQVLISRVYPN